ncbi:hypothetical protein N7492_009115 [Penicillium capsulatum]|uniref:Uncharacterized protein n=1 Tax=Penicillium capsulatum TaxID=69766 RepID=A0A9W9LHS1_9EURO|nr:hypothetical protein N7492_009115 [Penicillium capsulatum]KAJ6106514.1 hypothetical protein N7512_010031 [Penicillium capsulatum]
MANSGDPDCSHHPTGDQPRKINFVSPRRNIKLPKFMTPWTYTNSIATLMKRYETLLDSDESLALYMQKPLDACALDKELQNGLESEFPRVIEYQTGDSTSHLPPAWTHVIRDATPDQFQGPRDHFYRRCVDGVLVEVPDYVFNLLRILQEKVGSQPSPGDMRQEAEVVDGISCQLANLVEVLTATRDHVLRVQNKFQMRSDAIRVLLHEGQPQPVSNTNRDEGQRAQAAKESRNYASQKQHHSVVPVLPLMHQGQESTLGKRKIEASQSQPPQEQHLSPSDKDLEESQKRQCTSPACIKSSLSQSQLALNTEWDKGQTEKKRELSLSELFHKPPPYTPDMSPEVAAEVARLEALERDLANQPVSQQLLEKANRTKGRGDQWTKAFDPRPPQPQHTDTQGTVPNQGYGDTQTEAARTHPLQTPHPVVPSLSQRKDQDQQGQQYTQAIQNSPARAETPPVSQWERENSTLSSQGGDIPYQAPRKEMTSAAFHPINRGSPVYQTASLSMTQSVPRREGDIEMIDTSADAVETSDARSTITPNAEVMQDERVHVPSNPIPLSTEKGMEGIPIATNGHPMPPSADEHANGYYFIEEHKYHGKTWNELRILYAVRFNVLRSTNGLVQHWLRWRAQGRKLVILKVRQRPPGAGAQ